MKESKYKYIIKYLRSIEPSRIETVLENSLLQKLINKTEYKQILNELKNGTR